MILERAIEIASVLDPDLLRELETEFGSDFQNELNKAVEIASSGSGVITVPEKGSPQSVLLLTQFLDPAYFRRVVSYETAVKTAEFYKVDVKNINFTKTIAALYELYDKLEGKI